MHHAGTSSQQLAETCRYRLAWDNTQKLVIARGQSRIGANKMLLWANAFAVQSRVPYGPTLSTTLKARDIPLTVYLPNTDDYTFLRQRIVSTVLHILHHHIAFFGQHCLSSVVYHIPHQFTDKSALKSELVTTRYLWYFYVISIWNCITYSCSAMSLSAMLYGVPVIAVSFYLSICHFLV